MPQNIDETYADNPALAQAREAFYRDSRCAARMISAALRGKSDPASVRDALITNVPWLRCMVEAHDNVLEAQPRKDPHRD